MKKIHYIVLACLCLAVVCVTTVHYVYKRPIVQDEYANVDTTHLTPLFTAEDTWVSAAERITQICTILEEQEYDTDDVNLMIQLALRAGFYTTHKNNEKFNKEPLPENTRKHLNQIIITRQIPKPE